MTGGGVERLFLGWDAPLLPRAAAALAERWATAGVLDLRGVVPVVPGARAGRRLKELILEESTRRRLRLVPPQVVTVGSLPELFRRPSNPAPGPLLARRCWADALRSADPGAVESLFGYRPDENDLVGWHALGVRVGQLHREVSGGGFLFADVASICAASRDALFDDSERWESLAILQALYLERLIREGFADVDAERIERIRGAGRGSGTDTIDRAVWLVGVSQISAAVRAIIAHEPDRFTAVIHAPPEESGAFDEFGCVVPSRWSDRGIPLADSHVEVVDRPTDQAAAVVRALVTEGATALTEVVLATADDDLVPYLRESLESAGAHAHYAGGRSVRRTGPYLLLDAVAAYLERPEWEEFAALVRHPVMERWLVGGRSTPLTGRDPVGDLDLFYVRHLPATLSGTLAGEGGRPGVRSIRSRLESSKCLGRLRYRLPLKAWAVPILDFLAEIHAGTSLPPDDPELEVLRKIRDTARELHHLPDTLSPEASGAEAIRLLLESLASDALPEEPERTSIELLGWLELPLDDAPIAIVTGVNEGNLPESVNAHSFLPDRLRSRLGLLDNEGRYARDAFHLTAMLHCRRSVRLISGRLSGDGDPLRPSRLLLTVTGVDLARRVLSFAATAVPPGPVEPEGEPAAVVRSAFPLPPHPTIAFEVPNSLRVTDFRLLIQDPYRFVLERIYGLGSVDDQARELDGAAFGDLAHRVLQGFGDSAERRSTDPRPIVRRLDRILDDQASARFGTGAQPAVYIQIEQLRRRLRAFAEWHAAWVSAGWVVAAVEGGVPSASEQASPLVAATTLHVDGEPFEVRGRIDRIDHHPVSGRWAIFDYKTSDTAASPEETHRKRSAEWIDLQLPMYRHLIGSLRSPGGGPLVPADAPVELGYILLPREVDQVGARFAEWTDEDLRDADAVARDLIRTLRGGSVTFDPARVRIRAGDPLAPLLGLRLLVTAGGEGEEENGEVPS
jgi:ATP-dependent helicase/nuclease subunit B